MPLAAGHITDHIAPTTTNEASAAAGSNLINISKVAVVIVLDVGLTIPWNCKPSGEPYYKPPGLLIQYDEYYPYILLCDFKSL